VNAKMATFFWSLLVVMGLAGAGACGAAHTPDGVLATTPPTQKSGGSALAPASTPSAVVRSDPISWTLLKLPDTGQVKDYTPTFGEDSDYIINPPAYTDNRDGTVTDQVTGLVWQQTDGGQMTFESAVTYCRGLDLAGDADWRLPSTQELFSIADHDHNPALDTHVFPVTGAEYWWTANEQAGDSTKAWVVNAGGGIGAHPKNETSSAGGSKRFHARCVRDVSGNATGHLTDGGNGTVTDLNTGLLWQRDEVTPAVTWEAALSYCEDLSLGNRDDWRLPNVKELRSIVDDTRFRPSVDTTYLPGVRTGPYWSSTTLFGHPGSAWYVDFSSGLASYNDKAGQLFVRCVCGG
jgi:hypothetical protein